MSDILPDLKELEQRVEEAAKKRQNPKPEPEPEPFVPKVFSLACLYRGKLIQDAYKKYEAIAEETLDLPVYNSGKLDAAKEYVDIAAFCVDAEARFKARCFRVMYKVMTDEGESTHSAHAKFRILKLRYRAERDEEDYEPTELTAEEKEELRRFMEDDDYFNDQFSHYKEALRNEHNE